MLFQTHIHTHARTHARTHTHTHTHTDKNKPTHTHARIVTVGLHVAYNQYLWPTLPTGTQMHTHAHTQKCLKRLVLFHLL